MSDEIRELRNEIIALKENVSKLEGKNVDLSDKIEELNGRIFELIEKNDKLKEENEALKAEKSSQLMQQEPAKSTNKAIPTPESEGKWSNSKLGKKSRILANGIPNWLMFDTFPWINRKEMAISSLSTSSETFRQLCWPKLHQNVMPHKIEHLDIFRAQYEFGNERALVRIKRNANWYSEGIIPIASIPSPNYIVGIKQIEINFVNEQLVVFFESIGHLLQNCTICFYEYSLGVIGYKGMFLMQKLMEYLADKIFKLNLFNKNLFDFNEKFPGFIHHAQFLHFERRIGIYEIELLLKWLKNHQSNNGEQKIILFHHYSSQEFMISFIDRVKKEFINSNSPSNFLLIYNSGALAQHQEFTLENARTNEILTFYRKNGEEFYLADLFGSIPKRRIILERRWGEEKLSNT